MGSAMARCNASRVPMVVILGATGTGKTKLSVELAQKFNTEIISADSMQIYKGLDVVTAKATQRERSLAHHHLLDLLEPHQHFTVVDFRNRALKIIDKLIENGKIPIVVGGTTYYMESIVWNILVEDDIDDEQLLWEKDEDARKRRLIDEKERDGVKSVELNDDSDKTDIIDKDKLLHDIENEAFSNEEFHEKLKAIDPVMASRLHPNNRRKIKRAIEIWLKTGRRHSEILEEQRLTEGQLRRPESTVVFWLKCEQKVHDERLNARVDEMMENGLIEELLDFHDRHNKQRLEDGKPADYTKGIFQTLGFKEFHDYLMLNKEEKKSEKGEKLLQLSVENMKMATRRYARKQNKMVLSRFLDHPTRVMPPIYSLDTTDVSKWNENVQNKAIDIVECFLEGKSSQHERLQSTADELTKTLDVNSHNYCDVCQRIIIGDKTYRIHLESNKHKKMLKKQKKEQSKQKE